MKIEITGIQDSLKQIKKWKTIADNQDKVVEKLAEHGRKKLQDSHDVYIGVNQVLHKGGSYPIAIKSDMKTQIEKDKNSATIVASGENFTFFEFGAGVAYNNPRAWKNVLNISVPQDIAGIGEFGKGYGNRSSWIFRKDGTSYRSSGYRAIGGFAMAIDEIVAKIDEVIEEVANE